MAMGNGDDDDNDNDDNGNGNDDERVAYSFPRSLPAWPCSRPLERRVHEWTSWWVVVELDT